MSIYQKKFELLSTIYEEQTIENEMLKLEIESLKKKGTGNANNFIYEIEELQEKIKFYEVKFIEKENEKKEFLKNYKLIQEELELLKQDKISLKDIAQKLDETKKETELKLNKKIEDLEIENKLLLEKNYQKEPTTPIFEAKLISKDIDHYEKNQSNFKKMVGAFNSNDAKNIFEFGKDKNIFSKKDKKALTNIVEKMNCGVKLTDVMLSEFIRFYREVVKTGYLGKDVVKLEKPNKLEVFSIDIKEFTPAH